MPTQLKTQAIADAAITQPKLASGVGGNTDKSLRLLKVDQSIPDATAQLLNWTSEDFDTDNLHDNAVNNTRIIITAATAGKWLFQAVVGWAGNSAGQRIIGIKKNTGLRAQTVSPPPGANNMAQPVSVILDAAAGDFFEVEVFKDGGGALNVLGDRSHFAGIRIAS